MSKRVEHVDFSKHELIITDKDGLSIHHLKEPGTVIYNVKFINTNGILAVTGDVGNWIFCREFHPAPKGCVSDHYWLEKLHISSEQNGEEFDNDKTKEEIEEGINGGLEEYGYEGKELDEAIGYYKDLLKYVDLQEWEYTAYAYNNFPGFFDGEGVPMLKKIKGRLQIVFDAFEEICERLRKKEEMGKHKNITFKFGDIELKGNFIFDFKKLQKLVYPYDKLDFYEGGTQQ